MQSFDAHNVDAHALNTQYASTRDPKVHDDLDTHDSSTLREICATLFSRRPENEIDIKLDRMHGVLGQLGNPQNACQIVHIAGTNGKTSTSKYITQMLQSLGFKVGRYTSPHLYSVLERIEIDGQIVSEESFTAEYTRIIPVIEHYETEHPEHGKFGFFEVVTILAYVLFAASDVDFAVVEVGLGGRFDATNVSETVALSVITPIGVDHVDFLGNDIKGIAYEKAGIIKPRVPVVIAQQIEDVQAVLDAEVHTAAAKVYFVEDDTAFGNTYLAKNFALAKRAVEVLVGDRAKKLNFDQIFENSSVPGRLQIVQKNPNVMVDASHNPHGAKALVETLKALGFKHVIAVVAGFTDKDTKGFVEVLNDVVEEYIFTRNSSPRSHTHASIQSIFEANFGGIHTPYSQIAKDIPAAIVFAKKRVEEKSARDAKDVLILITGSVVTAGDAIRFLGNNPQPSSKLV